jgi:DNA-directed RNA polymerase specialized sigma24 family protein
LLRARLALLPSGSALLPPREVTEGELDDLMSRLASGDRAAFEPLFRALWPRAVGAARRRLELHAADDAAQSAMLRVFSRATEFRRGAPLLPWFYAIVANEVRGVARARTHAALELANATADGDDPERRALDREMQGALARAIRELDSQSAEAIGVLLGEHERPAMHDAAFRKRVSRAYAKLRVLLGVYRER